MYLISGKDYLARFPDFKLVNREEDLERISSILSRRQNNSLLLTGPGGVGTTSILLGLQAMKDLPGTSLDILSKQFFWLDIDKLFASGDGNEINKEFQAIIKSLERTSNAVLIIPNAYGFMEAAQNSGNSHFTNIINNADKSSSFQVIMETSDDQLTAVIKWNTLIKELYTLYDVTEPTGECLKNIVTQVAKNLTTFHGIKIDSSAINEAIHLSSKYRDGMGLGDAQPRRSISLLDRALSSYKQTAYKNNPSLEKYKNEIAKLQQSQADGEALRINLTEKLEQAKQASKKNSDNNASFDSLVKGTDSVEVTEIKKQLKMLDKLLVEDMTKYKEVIAIANADLLLTKKEVIVEFSKISGIPAAKLDENEIELLKNLQSNLLSRIYGQDDVIKHVANSIKVSRVDAIDESGPAVSYLFLGPSGVGKTETAKALAAYLYGDERALHRFDMSEYMEKHAVAKLIGAPPGYEGFEAGGILTNLVRKNPVGIYLFDEIEKAHDDVYNIFLQVLSDGRLTDNIGRTVDFSEAIIIMTSNIGQEFYLDKNLSDAEAIKGANKELDRRYRSELLNRFNGRENILHYKRLSMEVIQRIVQREIDKLNAVYEAKNLKLEISKECISAFCKDHYDIKIGARGLPGYIRVHLRPIVTNHQLENPNQSGVFKVKYNTESQTFNVTFKEI